MRSLVASGLALSLTVVPDPGGCSGASLHWVVLEPVGQAFGVHGWFTQHGWAGPWLGVVPLVVLLIGAVLVRSSWRGLARARAEESGRGRALLQLATGGWATLSAAWALVCWLAL